MSRKKKMLLIIVIFLFVTISISFPYEIFSICENGMFVTKDELNSMLSDNFFVSSKIDYVSASTGEEFDEYVIKYKLFNLFNIKNLKVNVIEPDRYFAGGDSLGFSLQSRGVILIGGNFIVTKSGISRPFEESGLKSGDIITEIDGQEVNNVGDIGEILRLSSGDELKIKVIRNGEEFETEITPALDSLTNSYKLGLWVKEDAVGIGTLTFINITNGRFGSLGHAITDVESGNTIEVSGGEIYKGKILGIKKGENGRAGELIGTYNRDDVLGVVDKNCEYGVYGYFDDASKYLEGRTSIDIGGRVSVVPGKAQILTCLDGENIEKFDIEIIKTNFQSTSSEKSMVLKITDKDLISKTGGIVQGMSGSPIVQNGKLIGAVTHVFVNDPTKGFGIYIDWMLEE